MKTACLGELAYQSGAGWGGRPERALRVAPTPVPIQPSCIS